LTEAGGGRRRRGQRVLYFFRTPPAIRVGREAIDAEAMRLLEHHNPDISFDWPRLLKQGAAGPATSPAGYTASAAPAPREERRRDRREPRRSKYEPPSIPAAPGAPASALSEPDQTYFSVSDAATAEGAPLDAVGAGEAPEPAEPPSLVETEPPPVDQAEPLPPVESFEAEEPVPDRYARLGREGLARLRGRYADVVARIHAKPPEQEDRAELEARAARLDPDRWHTADEVAAALEDYESVFESLRAVVGRHARRKR